MNSPLLQTLAFEQVSAPAAQNLWARHELRSLKQLEQRMPETHSKKMLAVVLLLHAIVFIQLLRQVNEVPEPKKLLEPMMVSLISAPQQETSETPTVTSSMVAVAKTVSNIKPLKKPIEKVQKKNQAKIEPIKTRDAPAEREASVDLNTVKNETQADVAPVQQVQADASSEVNKTAAKSEVQKAESASEVVMEPPRFGVAYLNNPAPDYPALSRRSGEEGRVLMKVLVSTEGAAEVVQIEKSSGSSRLDQAAIDAVKRWRFIPAQKNKQPLSAYVLVPIKFSLNS